MEIEINWIAVIVASIIGTAIAGIWYQEPVFGKAWQKLTGVTPKRSRQAGKAPVIAMLLANFVTATALAWLIYVTSSFFENHTVWFALLNGLIACLTFSITTLLVHNGFEVKPKMLTMVNGAYQLVLFSSMTLVISLFGI